MLVPLYVQGVKNDHDKMVLHRYLSSVTDADSGGYMIQAAMIQVRLNSRAVRIQGCDTDLMSRSTRRIPTVLGKDNHPERQAIPLLDRKSLRTHACKELLEVGSQSKPCHPGSEVLLPRVILESYG
jgi:hypothetical protein